MRIVEQLQVHAADVGDDLHPDAALGAAVGGEEALRAVAHVDEHVEMVAEAVADGLEQRAPQMAAAMRQRQADEGAACQRIVDRRLLAQEIGQADQPLAAGLDGRGEGIEGDVGALAAGRLADEPGEPVQRRARCGHAAVRRIDAGHEMVVEIEARIGRGMVGRHDDVAGAAELEQHVAGACDAGGERRGDMVGGPAIDREALRQAGQRRRLGGDRPHLLMRHRPVRHR